MKTESILEMFKQEGICHENCMGCRKYKMAKDKHNCPTVKLRKKYVRHCTYKAVKKAARGFVWEDR